MRMQCPVLIHREYLVSFLTSYSYLLPHLLPPKPALDIHGFRQQTHNTLQRLFKMSFVPAGFWERFIARMLISLQEMDMQVVCLRSPILIVSFSLSWPKMLYLCSHLKAK